MWELVFVKYQSERRQAEQREEEKTAIETYFDANERQSALKNLTFL